MNYIKKKSHVILQGKLEIQKLVNNNNTITRYRLYVQDIKFIKQKKTENYQFIFHLRGA